MNAPDASAVGLASTRQRLGTLLIDLVCFFAFSWVLGAILGLVGLGVVLESVPDLLLGIGILFVYYFPQEVLWGRTVGKRIMKTQAVGEDGSPLTPRQALGRTLWRFVPFEAFSFLGGDGRPRGWHDKFSKTKVVSATPVQVVAK
jgi:uncharacterized RDD family membrane protein YckC